MLCSACVWMLVFVLCVCGFCVHSLCSYNGHSRLLHTHHTPLAHRHTHLAHAHTQTLHRHTQRVTIFPHTEQEYLRKISRLTGRALSQSVSVLRTRNTHKHTKYKTSTHKTQNPHTHTHTKHQTTDTHTDSTPHTKRRPTHQTQIPDKHTPNTNTVLEKDYIINSKKAPNMHM